MGKIIKDLAIIFLFIVIAVMSYESCNMKSSMRKTQEELLEASMDNEILYRKIDKQGRELTKVESIVLEKNRQIEKNVKEISELKKLDAKVVFKTKTKIDTLLVQVRDTIIIKDNDTIYDSKFNFRNRWIAMRGSVKKESLLFDSLTINNEYNVELGKVRKGLFRNESVAFIRNDNPYTSTTEATSIILQDEKKWYQRDGLKLAISVVFGFMLGSRF